VTDGLIDVVVVDDSAVFRRGLLAVLALVPWVRVVGIAGSHADAIAVARRTRPTAMLVDLSLPDGNGLGIVSWLGRELPGTASIVISANDEGLWRQLALAAGASAFVAKARVVPELAAVLSTIKARRDGGAPEELEECTDPNADGRTK
jgi:DNA-binding NarL/FixJ family response regulator